MILKARYIALGTILTASLTAQAAAVFTENFENTMAAWTGEGGGTYAAEIVNDPLNSSNHVLDFTALTPHGRTELISNALFSSSNTNFNVSFDYLGTCPAGHCGAFLGKTPDLTGNSGSWLFGSHAAVVPDETGSWQHYSINFQSASPIHLMLEQWLYNDGQPGQVFFDNIVLSNNTTTAVPEPSSFSMMFVGFLMLVGLMSRRKPVQQMQMLG